MAQDPFYSGESPAKTTLQAHCSVIMSKECLQDEKTDSKAAPETKEEKLYEDLVHIISLKCLKMFSDT